MPDSNRAQAAWDALDTIMDPEVPVISIVDLGIVREVTATGEAVSVTLTPTYSGCPAIELIEQQVDDELQRHFTDVTVTSRLSPAWTTDWISDKGKAALKAAGIAPPKPAVTAPAAARISDNLLPSIGTLQADPPACPRCDSTDTREISRFGATACKAMWQCNSCREPFEYFKPLAGGSA